MGPISISLPTNLYNALLGIAKSHPNDQQRALIDLLNLFIDHLSNPNDYPALLTSPEPLSNAINSTHPFLCKYYQTNDPKHFTSLRIDRFFDLLGVVCATLYNFPIPPLSSTSFRTPQQSNTQLPTSPHKSTPSHATHTPLSVKPPKPTDIDPQIYLDHAKWVRSTTNTLFFIAITIATFHYLLLSQQIRSEQHFWQILTTSFEYQPDSTPSYLEFIANTLSQFQSLTTAPPPIHTAAFHTFFRSNSLFLKQYEELLLELYPEPMKQSSNDVPTAQIDQYISSVSSSHFPEPDLSTFSTTSSHSSLYRQLTPDDPLAFTTPSLRPRSSHNLNSIHRDNDVYVISPNLTPNLTPRSQHLMQNNLTSTLVRANLTLTHSQSALNSSHSDILESISTPHQPHMHMMDTISPKGIEFQHNSLDHSPPTNPSPNPKLSHSLLNPPLHSVVDLSKPHCLDLLSFGSPYPELSNALFSHILRPILHPSLYLADITLIKSMKLPWISQHATPQLYSLLFQALPFFATFLLPTLSNSPNFRKLFYPTTSPSSELAADPAGTHLDPTSPPFPSTSLHSLITSTPLHSTPDVSEITADALTNLSLYLKNILVEIFSIFTLKIQYHHTLLPITPPQSSTQLTTHSNTIFPSYQSPTSHRFVIFILSKSMLSHLFLQHLSYFHPHNMLARFVTLSETGMNAYFNLLTNFQLLITGHLAALHHSPSTLQRFNTFYTDLVTFMGQHYNTNILPRAKKMLEAQTVKDAKKKSQQRIKMIMVELYNQYNSSKNGKGKDMGNVLGDETAQTASPSKQPFISDSQQQRRGRSPSTAMEDGRSSASVDKLGKNNIKTSPATTFGENKSGIHKLVRYQSRQFDSPQDTSIVHHDGGEEESDEEVTTTHSFDHNSNNALVGTHSDSDSADYLDSNGVPLDLSMSDHHSALSPLKHHHKVERFKVTFNDGGVQIVELPSKTYKVLKKNATLWCKLHPDESTIHTPSANQPTPPISPKALHHASSIDLSSGDAKSVKLQAKWAIVFKLILLQQSRWANYFHSFMNHQNSKGLATSSKINARSSRSKVETMGDCDYDDSSISHSTLHDVAGSNRKKNNGTEIKLEQKPRKSRNSIRKLHIVIKLVGLFMSHCKFPLILQQTHKGVHKKRGRGNKDSNIKSTPRQAAPATTAPTSHHGQKNAPIKQKLKTKKTKLQPILEEYHYHYHTNFTPPEIAVIPLELVYETSSTTTMHYSIAPFPNPTIPSASTTSEASSLTTTNSATGNNVPTSSTSKSLNLNTPMLDSPTQIDTHNNNHNAAIKGQPGQPPPANTNNNTVQSPSSPSTPIFSLPSASPYPVQSLPQPVLYHFLKDPYSKKDSRSILSNLHKMTQIYKNAVLPLHHITSPFYHAEFNITERQIIKNHPEPPSTTTLQAQSLTSPMFSLQLSSPSTPQTISASDLAIQRFSASTMTAHNANNTNYLINNMISPPLHSSPQSTFHSQQQQTQLIQRQSQTLSQSPFEKPTSLSYFPPQDRSQSSRPQSQQTPILSPQVQLIHNSNKPQLSFTLKKKNKSPPNTQQRSLSTLHSNSVTLLQPQSTRATSTRNRTRLLATIKTSAAPTNPFLTPLHYFELHAHCRTPSSTTPSIAHDECTQQQQHPPTSTSSISGLLSAPKRATSTFFSHQPGFSDRKLVPALPQLNTDHIQPVQQLSPYTTHPFPFAQAYSHSSTLLRSFSLHHLLHTPTNLNHKQHHHHTQPIEKIVPFVVLLEYFHLLVVSSSKMSFNAVSFGNSSAIPAHSDTINLPSTTSTLSKQNLQLRFSNHITASSDDLNSGNQQFDPLIVTNPAHFHIRLLLSSIATLVHDNQPMTMSMFSPCRSFNNDAGVEYFVTYVSQLHAQHQQYPPLPLAPDLFGDNHQNHHLSLPNSHHNQQPRFSDASSNHIGIMTPNVSRRQPHHQHSNSTTLTTTAAMNSFHDGLMNTAHPNDHLIPTNSLHNAFPQVNLTPMLKPIPYPFTNYFDMIITYLWNLVEENSVASVLSPMFSFFQPPTKTNDLDCTHHSEHCQPSSHFKFPTTANQPMQQYGSFHHHNHYHHHHYHHHHHLEQPNSLQSPPPLLTPLFTNLFLTLNTIAHVMYSFQNNIHQRNHSAHSTHLNANNSNNFVNNNHTAFILRSPTKLTLAAQPLNTRSTTINLNNNNTPNTQASSSSPPSTLPPRPSTASHSSNNMTTLTSSPPHLNETISLHSSTHSFLPLVDNVLQRKQSSRRYNTSFYGFPAVSRPKLSRDGSSRSDNRPDHPFRLHGVFDSSNSDDDSVAQMFYWSSDSEGDDNNNNNNNNDDDDDFNHDEHAEVDAEFKMSLFRTHTPIPTATSSRLDNNGMNSDNSDHGHSEDNDDNNSTHGHTMTIQSQTIKMSRSETQIVTTTIATEDEGDSSDSSSLLSSILGTSSAMKIMKPKENRKNGDNDEKFDPRYDSSHLLTSSHVHSHTSFISMQIDEHEDSNLFDSLLSRSNTNTNTTTNKLNKNSPASDSIDSMTTTSSTMNDTQTPPTNKTSTNSTTPLPSTPILKSVPPRPRKKNKYQQYMPYTLDFDADVKPFLKQVTFFQQIKARAQTLFDHLINLSTPGLPTLQPTNQQNDQQGQEQESQHDQNQSQPMQSQNDLSMNSDITDSFQPLQPYQQQQQQPSHSSRSSLSTPPSPLELFQYKFIHLPTFEEEYVAATTAENRFDLVELMKSHGLLGVLGFDTFILCSLLYFQFTTLNRHYTQIGIGPQASGECSLNSTKSNNNNLTSSTNVNYFGTPQTTTSCRHDLDTSKQSRKINHNSNNVNPPSTSTTHFSPAHSSHLTLMTLGTLVSLFITLFKTDLLTLQLFLYLQDAFSRGSFHRSHPHLSSPIHTTSPAYTSPHNTSRFGFSSAQKKKVGTNDAFPSKSPQMSSQTYISHFPAPDTAKPAPNTQHVQQQTAFFKQDDAAEMSPLNPPQEHLSLSTPLPTQFRTTSHAPPQQDQASFSRQHHQDPSQDQYLNANIPMDMTMSLNSPTMADLPPKSTPNQPDFDQSKFHSPQTFSNAPPSAPSTLDLDIISPQLSITSTSNDTFNLDITTPPTAITSLQLDLVGVETPINQLNNNDTPTMTTPQNNLHMSVYNFIPTLSNPQLSSTSPATDTATSSESPHSNSSPTTTTTTTANRPDTQSQSFNSQNPFSSNSNTIQSYHSADSPAFPITNPFQPISQVATTISRPTRVRFHSAQTSGQRLVASKPVVRFRYEHLLNERYKKAQQMFADLYEHLPLSTDDDDDSSESDSDTGHHHSGPRSTPATGRNNALPPQQTTSTSPIFKSTPSSAAPTGLPPGSASKPPQTPQSQRPSGRITSLRPPLPSERSPRTNTMSPSSTSSSPNNSDDLSPQSAIKRSYSQLRITSLQAHHQPVLETVGTHSDDSDTIPTDQSQPPHHQLALLPLAEDYVSSPPLPSLDTTLSMGDSASQFQEVTQTADSTPTGKVNHKPSTKPTTHQHKRQRSYLHSSSSEIVSLTPSNTPSVQGNDFSTSPMSPISLCPQHKSILKQSKYSHHSHHTNYSSIFVSLHSFMEQLNDLNESFIANSYHAPHASLQHQINQDDLLNVSISPIHAAPLSCLPIPSPSSPSSSSSSSCSTLPLSSSNISYPLNPTTPAKQNTTLYHSSCAPFFTMIGSNVRQIMTLLEHHQLNLVYIKRINTLLCQSIDQIIKAFPDMPHDELVFHSLSLSASVMQLANAVPFE